MPQMRREATVLVTGGEYASGLAVGRALAAGGYRVVAAVFDPDSLLARSRAAALVELVPDPHTDASGHVEALGSLVRRTGAVVVLPGTEAALVALACEPEKVAPARAAAPPLPVVLRATSKAALEDLGAIGGIPQPRTVECSAEDVSGGLAVPTPAVVKPISSEVQTGGRMLHRTVVFADTVAEVAAALEDLPDGRGLVQERVSGSVVTVDGLAWQGQVVCSLQKEALRLWPAEGGAVPYVRTMPPDSLSDAARAVLRELVWSGPFNLQVVRGPTGDRLIDLNPRAPDSLGLARKAGLDVAVQWCDLLLGGTPRSATARVGVRWRSEEEEWWALVAAVRGHRWRDAVGIVRPHRRTAHAVWALGDPRPALLLKKRLLGGSRR